jgi:putative copper export protein/methionine-rich copper-binding protein CopC
MNRLRRAWLAAVLTLCVASLVHPAIAWAHAHLKKSVPGAKSTLDSSPPAIRLWFSEQPELSFTKVTLADSAGVDVAVGAVEKDPEGPMAVRVPIVGTLGNGLYTVSWKTAAADGHPSSGKFSFRVAAAVAAAAPPVPMPVAVAPTPPPAQISTPAETREPSALTPAFIVVRAISFAMLLSVIGAVAFRFVVLPRAIGLDASASDDIAMRIASFATGASALFLLAALAKLYLEMRMLSGNAAMDAEHLRTMTMSTSWGSAWRAQLLAALGAFVGFMVVQRIAAGWWLAALSAITLAVASAFGGHAASAEQVRTLAVATDALHILGAAGWMGSLLWLVVAAVGPGRSASRVASLVHAFSPAALAFAVIIAVTGLVSAWLRLGQLSALWSSGYGQVLLVKLALLAVLAFIGFHNWQRVRPTLGTDEATVRLERSAKLELGVGLLIIVVTAILVATPTPAS